MLISEFTNIISSKLWYCINNSSAETFNIKLTYLVKIMNLSCCCLIIKVTFDRQTLGLIQSDQAVNVVKMDFFKTVVV